MRGTEDDALIEQYSHENKRPREKEALHTLRKIASLVKPIMRARSWRVRTLAEFYPAEQNLLGLNINRGQKICLRLRYAGDANQFLPIEQVVDTMLHELSHNVIGPHNAQFHALWDQLRDEYEGLVRKGYTGEGFLSEGKRLGGRKIPPDEARRMARAAAEKRRTLTAGSGQKLGGAPVRAGTDIRKVIVDAIDRRNTVLKGCGSGEKGAKEIEANADQATQSGFKTKAEEDSANDAAIAQALWELVQEEEKEKYGKDYIPPSAENPTGNGGGKVGSTTGGAGDRLTTVPPPIPTTSKPTSPPRQPRHVSRLVTQAEPCPKAKAKAESKLKAEASEKEVSKPFAQDPAAPVDPSIWECPICTCHNPLNFLCCDACTTERPGHITSKILNQATTRTNSVTLEPISIKASTWSCQRCRTVMENQWWTCSTCGLLKASS